MINAHALATDAEDINIDTEEDVVRIYWGSKYPNFYFCIGTFTNFILHIIL